MLKADKMAIRSEKVYNALYNAMFGISAPAYVLTHCLCLCAHSLSLLMCSLIASAYVLTHCLCLCARSLPLLMCSLTASAYVLAHFLCLCAQALWLVGDGLGFWRTRVGMQRQTYFQLSVRLRCPHDDPFCGKQVRLTAVSLCRWIYSVGCSAFYIVLASAAYHIFTEKLEGVTGTPGNQSG